MTFTEAAVEVLRLVGKPLHYKKITEIAIDRDLLSHLGKTPEITMSSRLATMVKKDRGDAPIIKVKPGVFGLRSFSGDVLAAAQHESGHDYEITEPEPAPASHAETETETTEESNDEPAGETQALPGQDVFPAEDDDDEPILGSIRDASKDEEATDAKEDGSRRKRRRRRRGRGDDSNEDDGDNKDNNDGKRSRRNRDSSRRGRGRSVAEVQGDWERSPADSEQLGVGLVDAIERALGGRNANAKTYRDIADSLVRKGRINGDADSLAPTIAAAVRASVARSQQAGERPRFRCVDGGVILTEVGTPKDALRAERDLHKAAGRQREAVRRTFTRRLNELPNAGLLEILASWLNAEGIVGIRAVRRVGAGRNEFHLAGEWVQGPLTIPVAVVIYREGNVTRERVADVRGSVHHYGDARLVWIVGMSQIMSGAREEASATTTVPVSLYGSAELAEAMANRGIGMLRYEVSYSGLDLDLLERLTGPGRTVALPEKRDETDEQDEDGRSGEDADGADAAERVSASDDDDDADTAESEDAEEAKSDDDEPAEAEPERPKKRRRRRRRSASADNEEAASEADSGDGDDPGPSSEAEANADVDEDLPDAASSDEGAAEADAEDPAEDPETDD